MRNAASVTRGLSSCARQQGPVAIEQYKAEAARTCHGWQIARFMQARKAKLGKLRAKASFMLEFDQFRRTRSDTSSSDRLQTRSELLSRDLCQLLDERRTTTVARGEAPLITLCEQEICFLARVQHERQL